jgi:phytoene dehydrogenase-like protein
LPREADIVVIGAGAAGIAAARRIMAANRKVIVVEAASQIGGRCQTDASTFDVPFDRGARWMHNPETNPMIKLARAAGLEITTAPSGQKNPHRPPQRPRRRDRGISRRARCAPIAPSTKPRGGSTSPAPRCCRRTSATWADTAEFVLGASFSGKDLKDVSVGDKSRAQDRNTAIGCRQGLAR